MERNAKLYQIYRVFGYDYLFYTVINFLFFTMAKGFSVADLLYLSGFIAIFLFLFQIPINYLVEKMGLKTSMVVGNLFWIIHAIIVIIFNQFWIIVIAEGIAALGTSLKCLSETQYLYAVLKKTDNRKDFAKIEGKGVAGYYYFEAISALTVGFLFEINNYLPMYLTLTLLIISFLCSLFFDEIKQDNVDKKDNLKKYLTDFKKIMRSKRILCIFVYALCMAGLADVAKTLQKSVVVNLQVSPVVYSYIFAVITFCIGIGSRMMYKIEKVTKRKTLATFGFCFTIVLTLLGIVGYTIKELNVAMIIVVSLLFIHSIILGAYRMAIKKYMNNFTTSKIRGKILSLFYMFENIGKMVILFLAGYITDHFGTNTALIIIGSIATIVMMGIVVWMKKRLGLEPSQYEKEEIFGMEVM